VFTIGAALVQYYSFYLIYYPPVLEPTQGPKGEITQKATLTGFERELQDAAADLAARAKKHFEAAEDDYRERRYRDAAERYQKSIELLPTMSAYLNRGIALHYVSELGQAEAVSLTGLQIARKREQKDFEVSFLTNIGLVYTDQGKWEEALRVYQDALTLAKQLGHPQVQANALMNIGNVYKAQGKWEEALGVYQDALALNKQLGDPLGQANVLVNIGNVYKAQGKYEEALGVYQDALALDKQLGNSLGQAQDLGNIGSVYADQGKKSEAVEWLTQARTLYLQHGLNTPGLQIVEQTLDRLRSDKDRPD